MKMKCVKCKIERVLTEEEIKGIADMVTKIPAMMPDDYTAEYSIRMGRTCTDSKRHLFIFHEDFDKEMSDIIGRYLKNKDAYIQIRQIKKEIIDSNGQIKKLFENRIRKIEQHNVLTDQSEKEDKQLAEDIKRLTGDTSFEIWS